MVCDAAGDDTAPERIALAETAAAVERITERQAGTASGKTILSTEIKLEVFRHQQDDLTLIDLPGITRVALDGGDGEALEKQIKQLALRYIEPSESVILNVVSAMVDLATSAAVQMSLKVDPAGERSLLCVTMVDKHRDPGLYGKINQACTDMRISGNCVFAVCNRWEDAGDGTATRADEGALLHPLKDAGMPATSLGIAELSRHLVAIQCERIKQTLPATLKDIHEKKEELEVAATELGEPIEARGDAHCRVAALGLIDRVTQSLKQDLEGRTTAQEDGKGSLVARILGQCFEDRMDVESLQSLKAEPSGRTSEGHKFHGVTVYIETKFDPSHESLQFYVRVKSLPEFVESIDLSYTLSVEDKEGKTVKQKDTRDLFSHPCPNGWGWDKFVGKNGLEKLKEGAFSLHLVGDVQGMVLKDDKAQYSSEMLCALLKKHDDILAKDLDAVCSNRFLLSSSFRSSLSKRAEERQGCAGLPGTVSQEVPLNAIRDLLGKLPPIFERYCTSVHSTVLTAVTGTLGDIVPKDKFPRLEKVLKDMATEIMAEQRKATATSVKQILRWEENVRTSNHYYMSTVQSIRGSLFDSSSAGESESHDKVADETFADQARDRSVQMMGLCAKRVKRMSNVEQEVVDLQIKVFAYWKTMKKRILDYVQMAARSDLAVEPICNMFCTGFREAIEKHSSMSALMAPNADFSRRRCDIHRRLQSLTTAEELILARPQDASAGLMDAEEGEVGAAGPGNRERRTRATSQRLLDTKAIDSDDDDDGDDDNDDDDEEEEEVGTGKGSSSSDDSSEEEAEQDMTEALPSSSGRMMRGQGVSTGREAGAVQEQQQGQGDEGVEQAHMEHEQRRLPLRTLLEVRGPVDSFPHELSPVLSAPTRILPPDPPPALTRVCGLPCVAFSLPGRSRPRATLRGGWSCWRQHRSSWRPQRGRECSGRASRGHCRPRLSTPSVSRLPPRTSGSRRRRRGSRVVEQRWCEKEKRGGESLSRRLSRVAALSCCTNDAADDCAPTGCGADCSRHRRGGRKVLVWCRGGRGERRRPAWTSTVNGSA